MSVDWRVLISRSRFFSQVSYLVCSGTSGIETRADLNTQRRQGGRQQADSIWTARHPRHSTDCIVVIAAD